MGIENVFVWWGLTAEETVEFPDTVDSRRGFDKVEAA
jgi:hypothetical protein